MAYCNSEKLKEAFTNIFTAIEHKENAQKVELELRRAIWNIYQSSDVFIYNELDQAIISALCCLRLARDSSFKKNKLNYYSESEKYFNKSKEYIDKYLKAIENETKKTTDDPSQFSWYNTLCDSVITSNMFRDD